MEALNKKTIEDIDVKGKRVLARCDFNVPLMDGEITNDKRIVAALPTIKYLMEQGAKVILCSHLGRPKGEYKPEFSLAPVAKKLSEYLGTEVKLAEDPEVVGENAKRIASELKDGEVMLLENVRYRKEETKNEENFSKELASLGYSWLVPSIAQGISQRDLSDIKQLENDVLKLSEALIPLQSAYNAIAGEVGAPKKQEDEKAEQTIKNEKSLDNTAGGSVS